MSLRHVILTILSQSPSTGYDITRAFDERLSYFWAASHQQVYRDLRKMADDGLVEGEHVAQQSRPDKIIYRLTSRGREELQRWMAEPIAHRVNSEILAKMQAIDVVGTGPIIDMLEREREARAARLAVYRTIDGSIDHDDASAWSAGDIVRYAALRRGITGEEDWIGWIDETLARLQRLGARST